MLGSPVLWFAFWIKITAKYVKMSKVSKSWQYSGSYLDLAVTSSRSYSTSQGGSEKSCEEPQHGGNCGEEICWHTEEQARASVSLWLSNAPPPNGLPLYVQMVSPSTFTSLASWVPDMCDHSWISASLIFPLRNWRVHPFSLSVMGLRIGQWNLLPSGGNFTGQWEVLF